jgi:hypothetical protein
MSRRRSEGPPYRMIASWGALATAVVGAVLLSGCTDPPDTGKDDWSKAPQTEDERLAAKFIHLKNDGDPAAEELLGRQPAVPSESVSRAEADRLQTDFFLRQPLHIVGTRRGGGAGRLILATKGNVSAPRFQVQEGATASSEQRTMSNPDLTIEVHDGKIFGVRPALGQ